MVHKLILLLAILGISCGQNRAEAQNKLNPDAFEAMLKSDSSVQLVDVRTPQEFQSGHLNRALNINFNAADFSSKITQLDKNRPVMVYCAVGGRSASAASQLSKLGFGNVYDLKGGITAWTNAGKKMEK